MQDRISQFEETSCIARPDHTLGSRRRSTSPPQCACCIQTTVYLPSYIEWLTCFEMNKIVREAREQGRAVVALTNPDGSMTMPPLSTLGIQLGPVSRRYGY